MHDDWDSEEEFLGEMLVSGAAVKIEADETGELIITWNMKVLEEKYPAVHEIAEKAQMQELEQTLLEMVDDGLIEMAFRETEDGSIEELYSLTDKGQEQAREITSGLFDNDDEA